MSAQDTIEVSVDNTVYLTFPDKIEMVDLGKIEEYAAEVSNDNLVKVKALVSGSKASTIMVKYGQNYKQFFLQVVDKPKKYHYSFMQNQTGSNTNIDNINVGGIISSQGKGSSSDNNGSAKNNVILENYNTGGATDEKREALAKCIKVNEIPAEEQTLGFISKFLQASITVIRNDKKNTYLKISINNKSSLPYKLDFISFQYFQSMSKGMGKQKRKAPQDVYPVFDNKNDEIPPLALKKLVYAIPSFALANNGYLLVNFREKEGDRVLKIKITSDKIQSSAIIN